MKSIVEINEMTIEIYEKNNYKVWCFIRWFFLLDKSQPGSVFLLPGKMGGPVEKKSHHPILWLEHDDKKIYEEYIKYI